MRGRHLNFLNRFQPNKLGGRNSLGRYSLAELAFYAAAFALLWVVIIELCLNFLMQ
jgi:hypothetical protein